MGLFSWITNNTKTSIWNKYSEGPHQTVTMIDDKGNTWVEHGYEGYGEFGGKDYYELVAEMNGQNKSGEEARLLGINLVFENNSSGDVPHCKVPRLVEGDFSGKAKEELIDYYYSTLPPKTCPHQGNYFWTDEYEEGQREEDE